MTIQGTLFRASDTDARDASPRVFLKLFRLLPLPFLTDSIPTYVYGVTTSPARRCNTYHIPGVWLSGTLPLH